MSLAVGQYPLNEIQTSVTVADSARTGTFFLNGSKLTGIVFPASVTNASFDIQKSLDGVTYVDCYNSAGIKLNVIATDSSYVYIYPEDAFALQGYIRLYGVTGNESGSKVLTILSRPL